MPSKLDFSDETPIDNFRRANEIPPGYAISAYLSVMIGLLTMAVVNFFAESSEAFKAFVHQAGKAWMPGAEGIGPYSGKETFGLLAWFLSWIVLHFAFRRRLQNEVVWLTVFLAGIGLATTLFWPPVIHWLRGAAFLKF